MVLIVARALYSVYNFDAVLTVCQDALMIDDRCSEAHLLKGRALRKTGEDTLALTEFERAIQEDANNSEACFEKGWFSLKVA
mmetsp:Transcript_45489/g.52376  ORF Transcript_45489/g.52376 Transcript_45489/m.52376 type:complete len:82 (+) Transcript_45489:202-447(+)